MTPAKITSLRPIINEHKEMRAQAVTRGDQNLAAIQALQVQVEQLTSEGRSIADQIKHYDDTIKALEHAESVLREQMPDPTPVPPVPPVRDQSASDRELDEMLRTKQPQPEPLKRKPRAAQSKSGRSFSVDPSRVTRQARRQVVRQAGTKRPPIYSDAYITPEKITDPSPTLTWRADLLADLLREHGAMSQHDMAQRFVELLDGMTMQTAGPNVSDCVALLQHQRRIMFTGRKGTTTQRPDRETSPIWKLRETADEHANAGIPSDDDANPKTTDWPTPATTPAGHVHVSQASSGFETKR